MYQKIILILKSEKNREILKLTETAGKVRVEVGDGLLGALLLTDLNGGKSYEIKGKTFSIDGSLPSDVSAVAVINGETYSGFSGKTNRCPYLLEKLRSGGFDRKEENADSLSGNEIKDNTGNADESASGRNSFSDAKNKETSAEQGDEIILRAKTKSESKDKTEGAKKDKPTMLLGVEFNGKNFYQAVKPQLEEMFVCYPTETRLCERIPNSKWVRVDCEDCYYVVGVIEELGEALYVCYGIPGREDILPPDEIRNISQFVPVDDDGGIWMLFQDAKTGRCLSRDDVVKI